jgi:putative spermidine/putrescine transport system substrate-binding protein
VTDQARQVALGDPLRAGAAFSGVVSRRSPTADDIAPATSSRSSPTTPGRSAPRSPPARRSSPGRTTTAADAPSRGITWKVVVPSDAPPVASYYNSAINNDAAHPAAARCWLEYIFSDAGQNTWLKGSAIPVRIAAMQTAGTVDQAAFAALNPPTTTPVMLTQAQTDAAKAYLTENWKFITIQ